MLCKLRDGTGDFGDTVRYIVCQKEVGASETPHLQGYIEFHNPRTMAQCKSIVGERAHVERRRSKSAKKAIDYCKKAEGRLGGPWEWGIPAKQGKRNDIEEMRLAIARGVIDQKTMLEDHGNCMAKYPRFYGTCVQAYLKDGWRKVKVTLLYGNTGLGKTRWVYDNWVFKGKSFWRLPCITTQCWFDGYEGQTHVLLDDFAGAASKVSVVLLLQLLDGYQVRAPVKGSFCGWIPKNIAITTNLHPYLWYRWKDRMTQYLALARRIHTVKHFVKHDDVISYKDTDPLAFFMAGVVD